MPLPTPNSGESEEDFLSRCMGDSNTADEFPDESQRYAVCIAQIDNILNQESYTDYPQAASDNAQRALKFLDESGNPNDCLTPVGFARANQLAKREPVSRDTIARMAAFERHRQYKDVPYEDGCGGVAWDCWGGDEGIAWAQRKLSQIDRQDKAEFVKDMMKLMYNH